MINLFKQRKYFRAVDRIAKIKKFHTTILIYTVIIFVIAGLNYYANKWTNPWFIWIAFGLVFRVFDKAIKAFEWFPFSIKKENKN